MDWLIGGHMINWKWTFVESSQLMCTIHQLIDWLTSSWISMTLNNANLPARAVNRYVAFDSSSDCNFSCNFNPECRSANCFFHENTSPLYDTSTSWELSSITTDRQRFGKERCLVGHPTRNCSVPFFPCNSSNDMPRRRSSSKFSPSFSSTESPGVLHSNKRSQNSLQWMMSSRTSWAILLLIREYLFSAGLSRPIDKKI